MEVLQNFNLQHYNTFGVTATAQYFAIIKNEDDVSSFANNEQYQHLPCLVLGGGSNILFTQNYKGIVLKNEIENIEIIKANDTPTTVTLKVGSGVNWHQFVLYCISNNYAGIENLSLIPGTVGAAPIQNIGAYGVEVKDTINAVTFYNYSTHTIETLNKSDCQFGYRDSIFKQTLKGKVFITSVELILQKTPSFNTSYGAIQTELAAMGVTAISIKAISDAVINIRSSKLPNPLVIGNAGSFFKNPSVSLSKYEALIIKFPNLVGYVNNVTQTVKLAAGWLIEYCGYKGYRQGNVGCHYMQALVLVNYGNATGTELFELSTAIINKVSFTFGVVLEREVNII